MNNRLLFTVLLLLGSFFLHAQESGVQTVRGQVIDDQSKSPLPGCAVALMDSLRINSLSDENGNFRLNGVPVGRHAIRITMLGYKERVVNVIVSSGKEVVLTVELEERVYEGEEVVIEAEKAKANNDMATVSARSFTIEETQRYAGSLGDPARMAANYAGAQTNNDSRNDIIVRGNSPLGILWRFNGMDIPNPNHFGSFGSTGGPVSILNNNVLDNSDFLTGAFPAEYGNAMAGVFDLRMRNGNNEKHEFMGQVGFNGFEAGLEGPFSKKHRASYLINYRYSTLGLFHKLGINFGTGTAIPAYQDASFKLNFPTEKAGIFSVFGIGGKSYAKLLYSERDTTEKDLFTVAGFDTYYGSYMAAGGISHAYNFGTSGYGKLTIGSTWQSSDGRQDSVTASTNAITHYYGQRFNQGKATANYVFVWKFNARNTLKSGVFADYLDFTIKDSVLYDGVHFRRLRNSSGNTWMLQAYTQWQHKFSDRLTLNTGVHYQQLLLNNSLSVEPRAGLRYALTENQSLSLGGGMHSQVQPIFMYFNSTRLPDGGYLQTNHDLGFSRSAHAVLAYDRNFSRHMRLKAETYYQYLYEIPVTIAPGTYSGLNEGADFGVTNIDSLVNKGTGRNIGMEITVERFYNKGYYFLVTGSLYDSKYKGSDGVERNTAFNGNYTLNVLGGKEFAIGKKNVLEFNSKVMLAGGKHYTPINFDASVAAHDAVYFTDKTFAEKYSDYFRLDLKVGFTRNGKHITQQWAVDMTNITNHDNIFMQVYDPATNSVKTNYQMGLFIVPMYKLTF